MPEYRGTSFILPVDLHKRLNIAAAASGMSASNYIRASLEAALKTHAEHDPVIEAAFRVMDDGDLAAVTARYAEGATEVRA